MTDGYTYAATTTTASMESVLQSFKEADWLINYEIDPSWSKFCSFGPDDIGGVWEKIGAIRKRPRFDTVVMSPGIAETLRGMGIAATPSERSLFGMRVSINCSPLMLNRALLINTKFA